MRRDCNGRRAIGADPISCIVLQSSGSRQEQRRGRDDDRTDRTPWYDADTGVLDRRIFSDPEIYQQELQRIFARAWNFVCHESQLPQSGSFFMNYIGEDQVIVVRDRTGKINVLLNSCSHRGNSVCRAEQGRTNSFLCSYHGWNYDLDGRLIAIPGQEAFYRNDFDKSEVGPGQSGAGRELSRLRVRHARSDGAAARGVSRLGGPARYRHDRVARRSRSRRWHPEEPPEVQLEARGRQPVRLVSREDFARLGDADRFCAGRSDGADEPDGDPRRIRSRHRRAGCHPSGARRIRGAHARTASASRSGTTCMAARRLDPRVQQSSDRSARGRSGIRTFFRICGSRSSTRCVCACRAGRSKRNCGGSRCCRKSMPAEQRRFVDLHGQSRVRSGRPARTGRRRELEPLDARCEGRGHAAVAAELRDGSRSRSRQARSVRAEPHRNGGQRTRPALDVSARGRSGCRRTAGRN